MANKRILVVDDEKNLTAALESFFRSKGHEIYIANSGDAALDILKKEPISLLVIDLNMPGIDGVEVAKNVMKKYPDTKVLILTAFSEEYKDKLASIKADDIMTKPFGILSLIKKVEELLGEAITPAPAAEPPTEKRPVRILFVDPVLGYILRDYVLPYIKLSWGRNIQVESMSPIPPHTVKEMIVSFKPDIVLLSAVLTEQVEALSKGIAENVYQPKEVVLYNMPDKKTAKDSPLFAYYSMQKSLMDPDYLSNLNELIRGIAVKHNLITADAFRKERPEIAELPKVFTKDDVANFVKEAITRELNLKDLTLTDKTSFVDDLGVDSLDAIELVMALEETFGFDIPDETVQKLNTIGSVIEYIKDRANLDDLARKKRQRKKVLIVDDQAGMCKFLENYFLAKGYDALSTTEGERVLGIISKQKPDIVLLDIRMPDIDGIELLKQIKETDHRTKVVMVSVAYEREKEAAQCGADAFIRKPFPITYLEQTVIKKIRELTEHM